MVVKNNAGKNSWQLKTIWYDSERLKVTQAQKTTHPIYSWMYKCPGCRQTRPNDFAELLLTHTKTNNWKTQQVFKIQKCRLKSEIWHSLCALVCRGVHRITDLEKFPFWISKDEALTPMSAVGPLFISLLSFHLSRALLGTWCFRLFHWHCVCHSFYNRLDLIMPQNSLCHVPVSSW